MDNIIEKEQDGSENKEKETKTFTEEQVLLLISQEKEKTKKELAKEMQKKYEKQLSLSKLDDEARAQAEKDDELQELRDKVAQMTIEANRSELKSTLSARGLSAEFADILNITDDAEANQKVIATLDKLFKKAVNDEVNNRINSSNVKKNDMPDTMTKEYFNKMNLAEQSQYLMSHPEFKRTVESWY